MTEQEMRLLDKLNAGALDGIVGNELVTSGGSTCWMAIEDGVPKRFKQGPGGNLFDGKENERYSGVLHVLQTWSSDLEKLEFLQKYGWLMNDQDVEKYSAGFYSEVQLMLNRDIKKTI